MNNIPSYGKIWNMGHPNVAFVKDELRVDIEEKVDGSQFSALKFEGDLFLRSKNAFVFAESPPNMFLPASQYLLENKDKLDDGWVYRFETLQSKRHNHLTYDRIPLNHLVLFDVHSIQGAFLNYEDKAAKAAALGVDVVPLLHSGPYKGLEQLLSLLKEKSYLGGPKIEGVVLKPWEPRWGADGKRFLAKFVSEVFKEEQKISFKASNPTQKDKIAAIAQGYANPARFRKVIQHREENGELERSYRDIGPLMKDLSIDIETECKEAIKEALWKGFRKEIMRAGSKGFVQWYKEHLVTENDAVETEEEIV